MRIVQGDSYSATVVTVAALILAGALAYAVLTPKPALGKKYQELLSKPLPLEKQAAAKNERYAKLKTEPLPHLYTTSSEEAAPDALRRLDALGRASHVLVNGFRPQKELDAGDVQILPYYMTVVGSFDGISKFLQALSSQEPKLAISLIQISAPETGNTQVTASINVVGYLKPTDDSAATDDSSGKIAAKTAIKPEAELGRVSGKRLKTTQIVTVPSTGTSNLSKVSSVKIPVLTGKPSGPTAENLKEKKSG